MFYDTYPLVSEYCPGCGQHEEVICDEIDRFPLLVEVKGSEKNLSSDMAVFFSDTKEALFITKDELKTLIDHYKPNIIVSESAAGYEEEINPCLIYVNYRELRTLLKYDRGFFVTGLIMAIYSDDPEKAMEEYHTIQRCVKKGNAVIHVANEDFIISKSTEKTISLDIDGKVIR